MELRKILLSISCVVVMSGSVWGSNKDPNPHHIEPSAADSSSQPSNVRGLLSPTAANSSDSDPVVAQMLMGSSASKKASDNATDAAASAKKAAQKATTAASVAVVLSSGSSNSSSSASSKLDKHKKEEDSSAYVKDHVDESPGAIGLWSANTPRPAPSTTDPEKLKAQSEAFMKYLEQTIGKERLEEHQRARKARLLTRPRNTLPSGEFELGSPEYIKQLREQNAKKNGNQLEAALLNIIDSPLPNDPAGNNDPKNRDPFNLARREVLAELYGHMLRDNISTDYLKQQIKQKAEMDVLYQKAIYDATPWQMRLGSAVSDGFYGGIANGVGNAVGHYTMRAIDWLWNGLYYRLESNQKARNEAVASAQREESMLRQRSHLMNNSTVMERTARTTQHAQQLIKDDIERLEKGRKSVKDLLTPIKELEKEHSAKENVVKAFTTKLATFESIGSELKSIEELSTQAEANKAKLAELIKKEKELYNEVESLRTAVKAAQQDQSLADATQKSFDAKVIDLATAQKAKAEIIEVATQAQAGKQKINQLFKQQKELHDELLTLDAQVKKYDKKIDEMACKIDEDLKNEVIMTHLKVQQEKMQAIDDEIEKTKMLIVKYAQAKDIEKIKRSKAKLQGLQGALKILGMQTEVCMELGDPENYLEVLKDQDKVQVFGTFLMQHKTIKSMEIVQANEQMKTLKDAVVQRLMNHNDNALKFDALDEAEINHFLSDDSSSSAAAA